MVLHMAALGALALVLPVERRAALLSFGALPFALLPRPCSAVEERMVAPILGNIMSALGPGGFQLNPATAQLGKLRASLDQLEQLVSDLQDPR